MIENIRLAFQGIFSHKLRSFLTMLGVIIGIASIIAIVSTIQGTNEQIMQNLIGAGNNAVTISLMQGDGEYYMDAGVPAGITPVSEEQKEAIRKLSKAADATFYLTRSYVDGVSSANASLSSARALGIDSHYLSTCGYEVYEGRPFVESDYACFHKVLLLDETASGILFPDEDPIGKIVEVRSEPFTVVGLIRKADKFQPVIESYEDYMTYTQEEYGMLLMPDASWPIVFLYDEPENCSVRAVRTEDMSSVGRDAESIMNQSVNGSNDISYHAEDLLEKAKNRQELSASTNNLLIWVASIALLVGGIGVMNIMLVSVTERTSEIGLKKAIGARKKTILLQFLTESAVLTSMGGVIGVVVGIILSQVISRMTETPVSISVPAIILSVAFSMLIGIIFGILPSIKAANLNPIDALRSE